MKYIAGSLIISFGILLVLVIVSMSMNIRASENGIEYFMLAWLGLAIITYPLARKIVRNE